MKVDIQAILNNSLKAQVGGLVSRGIKSVEIDANGHLIITLTNDSTVDLGKVVGEDGTDGEDGADGVSPAITGSKVGKVTTLTIVDAEHPSGTTLATINDGTDGVNGQDGTDGEDGTDGVSPTLRATKSGKTTTVYYTDAAHPTEQVLATINDGEDGSSYTLPQATAAALGGIKAAEKASTDTQEVKIDPTTGKLYVAPADAGNEFYCHLVRTGEHPNYVYNFTEGNAVVWAALNAGMNIIVLTQMYNNSNDDTTYKQMLMFLSSPEEGFDPSPGVIGLRHAAFITYDERILGIMGSNYQCFYIVYVRWDETTHGTIECYETNSDIYRQYDIGLIENRVETVEEATEELAGTKEEYSNKVTSMNASSTNDEYPSAKAVYEALAGKQDFHTLYITEDDVTVTTDDTKGVAPYNGSYGYTNITINNYSADLLADGLTLLMFCSGDLVVSSTYRNTRIRFGADGDWIPVFVTASIAAGSTFLARGMARELVFTTSIYATGAFHIFADNNTAYSLPGFGVGYGTCTTAAATAAKVVTLSSYALTTGGIVAVKFTYGVPANATMNVNNKGAKAIYYKDAAITADIIKAGDVATFIYNGSQYVLLAIDRKVDAASQDLIAHEYSSEESYSPGQVVIKDGSVYFCSNPNGVIRQPWNASDWSMIPDVGYMIGALSQIVEYCQSSLLTHSGNSNIHVTAANKTAWGNKYDKPDGGIPSTDMAAAVQTSLGKADTALQAHQSLAAYRTSAAQDVIDAAIEAVIPAQASSSNQLADKNFVNSSIATNTAYYISNNGQPFSSVAQLEAYSGTVTNNDYAFVTGTDEQGNAYFDRYKATVSGSTVTWAKEFRLNNSSFTAAQWAAISSGITSGKVSTYDGYASLISAKYTKPSSGIPASDMTSAVQVLLGKANSAVQPESGKGLFSGSYNDLTNKPTIPDELSDLSDDSTHRLVTDTEKATWNAKPSSLDSCLKNNENGTLTGNSSDTPLYLKSQSTATYLGFKNNAGTTLGYFGVNSSKKPVFYDGSDKELAYASHNQAASTITAGTFPGQIVANNNTNYTTKQVRNIILSTSDPSGGSNGDIWIKYNA